MANNPKPLENYNLIINPEGDALLLMDALPQQPQNPTIIIDKTQAIFQRSPTEIWKLKGIETDFLKALASLEEISIFEQIEPELGEDVNDEKEYTAKIKCI